MIKNRIYLLVTIVLAAGCVLWASPNEKTLGSGIKLVYIHVSFIWASMVGFAGSGLLGLVCLFRMKDRLVSLQETIGRVAFVWFMVGLVLSIFAAKVNWGAVYWQEPRMIASLKFILVAILVLLTSNHIKSGRIKSGLHLFLAFYLMWSFMGISRVLHPQNPIVDSSSLGIQMTFLSLFILNLLAEIIAVFMIRQKNVVLNSEDIEQGVV